MAPADRPPSARRGLTLLEVAISFALLITLLVPIYLLLVRSREHASDTRSRQLARAAAEHQVERMREATNRGAFSTLPDVFGGYRFAVPGLPPRKDGSGQPHGFVQVIVDESTVGLDLDGADSDGDGDARNDVLTSASRYRALPVRVSIWWGVDPQPQVVLEAVIAKRTDYLRTHE
jgi:type II secretory pathway pseudopilin PulG